MSQHLDKYQNNVSKAHNFVKFITTDYCFELLLGQFFSLYNELC